jgi:PAS domain S-box-containing protein
MAIIPACRPARGLHSMKALALRTRPFLMVAPLAAAAVMLAWIDPGRSFEQPVLLLVLNTVFYSFSAMLISIQFARTFLSRGDFSMLMLACGALIWGTSGFIGPLAAIFPAFERFDANILVTIHNTSVWLSAILHLGAVTVATLLDLSTGKHRKKVLVAAYGAIAAAAALIALLTWKAMLPVFFIPGQGGTIARQFVVSSSIAMFILAAILLHVRNSDRRTAVGRMYQLALLLMAAGLFAVLLQQTTGSLLGWYARILQYLGGIAMLVASLQVWRGGTQWEPQAKTATPAQLPLVKRIFLGTAVAIAAVSVTGSLQFLAGAPDAPEFTSLTFLPAVLFSLLLGGTQAGAICILLSLVLVGFFRLLPTSPGHPHFLYADLLNLLIFLGMSAGVTVLFKNLQSTRARMITAMLELQHANLHRQDAVALQESENRLQNVIEGTSAGTWDWDVETGRTVFNERWAQIVGYNLEDLSPCSIATWERLAHPEDMHRSNDILQRVFAREVEIYDCECRMRHRDGHWVWVHDRGKVVEWTSDGKPRRMIGSHTDISDRKELEERLTALIADFRNIIESTTDLIVVATTSGDILYANGNFSKKLGYSQEDLASMPLLSLHPPEVRDEAQRIFASMLNGDKTLCPLPIMTKAGLLVPVETRVWLGTWSGRPCIFGFIRDLTGDMEERQRFEALFRHNPAVMAINSFPERRFLDVNDAFLETFGYDRQDIIGRTADELNLFVNADGKHRSTHELATAGRIKNHLHQILTRNGSLVDGLFSGEIISSQGKQYLVTVMIDLTSRLEAERKLFVAKEKAESADAEKSRMLAVIAHEFRTPLALLHSSLDIIERYAKKMSIEDRQAQEKHIRSSLQQMTTLVDIAQSYNWLQSDSLHFKMAELELVSFCQEIVSEVRAAWSHNHVLTLRLPERPLRLLTDEALLRSILSNLLTNAFRYTPPGKTITFEAGRDAETLHFLIEDTGKGIPAADLDNIFKPYTRGSNVSNQRGMGLGLSIVAIALDKMGGSISLRSTEGEGTSVTIDIPIPEDPVDGIGPPGTS